MKADQAVGILMDTCFSSLALQVAAVVRESGDIIRTAHGKPRTIRRKGPIDLVTETDPAVEIFLKNRLAALVPEAAFLAEESATSLAVPDLCWIIDPLDGTTNFVHGLPFVATSVALWDRGEVRLAVVNAPLLNECHTAEKGRGTCLNGRRVSVSEVRCCAEALTATGFPYSVAVQADAVLATLRPVLRACRGVRRCGAAALDMAWVACGRFDAFYERDLKPWDTAAGFLLVTEAGGCVTTMDGAPFVPGLSVLADNGRVHDEMLYLLHPKI